MKKATTKAKNNVRDDQEKAARKTLLKELFNDFHTNRFEIYQVNFFRGIFFGLGSVIGGTVVIAMIIWILTLLSNNIPALSNFFEGLQALFQSARE